MTDLEKLEDAIDLKAAGRNNAAKATWESITPKCKVRILKFVNYLSTLPNDYTFPAERILFNSPFGKFTLSQSKLDQWKTLVPELAI